MSSAALLESLGAIYTSRRDAAGDWSPGLAAAHDASEPAVGGVAFEVMLAERIA
jgi:hypothetical protein